MIYLFLLIYLFIYLSIHLITYLSMYLFIYLSIYFIHLFIGHWKFNIHTLGVLYVYHQHKRPCNMCLCDLRMVCAVYFQAVEEVVRLIYHKTNPIIWHWKLPRHYLMDASLMRERSHKANRGFPLYVGLMSKFLSLSDGAFLDMEICRFWSGNQLIPALHLVSRQFPRLQMYSSFVICVCMYFRCKL